MVRVGDLEVRVLDSFGTTLPEVTHESRTYVVAQPGMDYRIECSSHTGRGAQTSLWVDTDKVDMVFNTILIGVI